MHLLGVEPLGVQDNIEFMFWPGQVWLSIFGRYGRDMDIQDTITGSDKKVYTIEYLATNVSSCTSSSSGILFRQCASSHLQTHPPKSSFSARNATTPPSLLLTNAYSSRKPFTYLHNPLV